MTEQDRTDQTWQPPDGDTTFITAISGATHRFAVGDIIDGAYRLTALLGQGGMGVVFACRHDIMGKDYAIKILSGNALSEQYWARFKAEAQALAKLNHPGIVGIHNMGVDGGQFPYYVMDLLSGEALDARIQKRGAQSINESLDIFIQIADALSQAHLQGIVHRDVKPSNMMLVDGGRSAAASVKIVDFGIARLSKKGFEAQSQTKTGLVFGTPFYMSPEQCKGLKVDERSDIYSLGCSLFECLTGRPPFVGDNSFHTFLLHQKTTPPRLIDVVPSGNFPQALESALAKMLAKNLSDRYQTMAQIKHDLERIKAGKSVMAQGLSSSQSVLTKPAQPASTVVRPVQDRKQLPKLGSEQDLPQDAGPDDFEARHSAWSVFKIVTASLTAVFILTVVGFSLFHLLSPPPAKVKSRIPEEDLMADMNTFRQLKDEAPILIERVAAYEADPHVSRTPLRETNPAGFLFAKDFIIGAIRIGDDQPLPGVGFVPCPADKHVCLILTKYIDLWPGFWQKVGPDDLNGIEIKTKDPQHLLDQVSKWHKLNELCFFNTLLKAVPDSDRSKTRDNDNEATSDESALSNNDLARIDNLTQLKSLGLCGVKVTGGAIVQMNLLNHLSVLKLKRVSDIQTVLDVLPSKDNLKELWLVAQDTTDSQVEALTEMKNLETLRIRRSKLTSASLKSFKKMPNLKHLIIDKQFPDMDDEQILKELPAYQYEPMAERTFWKLLP